MKILKFLTLFCCVFSGCKEDNVPPFVAGEVLVVTKAENNMNEVFEFVNSQDNSVESILSAVYESSQSGDSLGLILKHINQKTYTHRDNLLTTGQLNSLSGQIQIFPKLYQMNEIANQQDWVELMQNLRCFEVARQKLLLIQVPKGSEREWIKVYQRHAIVESAELNYISEVNR